MTDSELRTIEPVSYQSSSVVPTGYAEKAMASLMQLHSELMDEKERRVDLYRRLMDKEQVLAELRMYVQMLEEKLASKEDGWGSSGSPRPVVPRPSSSPTGGPFSQQRSSNASAQSTSDPVASADRKPYRASAFQAAANINAASPNGPADGWRAW